MFLGTLILVANSQGNALQGMRLAEARSSSEVRHSKK
jgi:hypothetical protein